MKGQVLALKRTLVELWKKLWKKTENYHRESRPDLGLLTKWDILR